MSRPAPNNRRVFPSWRKAAPTLSLMLFARTDACGIVFEPYMSIKVMEFARKEHKDVMTIKMRALAVDSQAKRTIFIPFSMTGGLGEFYARSSQSIFSKGFISLLDTLPITELA